MDVECLIDLKVPIAASKGEERLLHAIPLFVALDGPQNFIYNQADLRCFLMKKDTRDITSVILSQRNSTASIGAAFVEFLLHPHISDHTKSSGGCDQHFLFEHPFVTEVVHSMETKLNWRQGDELQELDDEEFKRRLTSRVSQRRSAGQNILQFFKRLTPKAWSTLIMRATTVDQVNWIFVTLIASQQCDDPEDQNLWVETGLRTLQDLEKKQSALPSSNFRAFHFVYLFVKWLCETVRTKERESEMMITRQHFTSNTLFASVAHAVEKGNIEPVLDYCTATSQKCPIESIPFLFRMYLAQSAGDWSGNLETLVGRHLALLSQQGFSEVLRKYQHGTDSEENCACKPCKGQQVLTLLAWAQAPFISLNISRGVEDGRLLKELVQLPGVGFSETVQRNRERVAPLALFLAQPDYVDTSTYNHFAEIFNVAPIQPKLFLIGQKGNPIYPPYFITVFPRKLSCHKLLENVRAALPAVIEIVNHYQDDTDLSGSFDYDLSTGLSDEIFANNLKCLGGILLQLQKLPQRNNTSHADESTTYKCAACVLSLWFKACGIKDYELRSFLKSVNAKLPDLLNKACASIKHQDFVYKPFASICSPQLKLPGLQKIFGCTEKDVHYTIQMLMALQPADSPLSNIPLERLIRNISLKGGFYKTEPTEEYRKIPQICASAFGEFAAELVTRCLNQYPGAVKPNGSRTDVTFDYTKLQEKFLPFARVLMQCTNNSMSPDFNSVDLIVEVFLEKFKSSSADLQFVGVLSATLFRVLMSTIGISPLLNTQSIYSSLVKFYNELNLTPCRSSLNELGFFWNDHRLSIPIVPLVERENGVFVQIPQATAIDLSNESIDDLQIGIYNSIQLPVWNHSSIEHPKTHASNGEIESKSSELPPPSHTNLKLFNPIEPVADRFQDETNELHHSANRRFSYIVQPSLVLCDDILFIKRFKGFVNVHVSLGQSITLIEHTHEYADGGRDVVYEFVSPARVVQKKDEPHLTSFESTKRRSICTLHDHGGAWDMLMRLPQSSTLFAHGVLLTLQPNGEFRPFLNCSHAQPNATRTLFDVLESISILNIEIHPFVRKACVICARAIVTKFSTSYCSSKDPDGSDCIRHYRRALQFSFSQNKENVMKAIAEYCKGVSTFLSLIVEMINRKDRNPKSLDRVMNAAAQATEPTHSRGTKACKLLHLGYKILSPVIHKHEYGERGVGNPRSLPCDGELSETLKAFGGPIMHRRLLQVLTGGEDILQIQLAMSDEAAARSSSIINNVLEFQRQFLFEVDPESITPEDRTGDLSTSAVVEPNEWKEEDSVADDDFQNEDFGGRGLDDGLHDTGDFCFDLYDSDDESENVASEIDNLANSLNEKLDEEDERLLGEWERIKWKKYVNLGHAAALDDCSWRVGSIYGPNCLKLRYISPVKDERRYRPERGLLICSIFPSPAKSLFADEAPEKDVTNFLEWLSNVARAPLRKDLSEYLLMIASDCGNMVPLPRVSMDEKVCMFGLQVRCPVKRLQERIRTILLEDEQSHACEEFCSRSDGQYGIRFSHRGTLRKLERLGITVRRIDFSVEYETKCESISSLYLRVIDEFVYYPAACFIFVQGLKLIEDTLMKWIAEYTQRNPWHWVIFEDTNTTLNLPENMDRAIQDPPKFKQSSDEESSALYKRRHKFEVPVPALEISLASLKTGKVSAWEDRFQEELRISSWVMISGDPGIGKTFFLKEFMEKPDTRKEYPHMQRIDGSSDRFVREAITDVLDDLVEAARGAKFLLCLDEYHMCTAQQKIQLLTWAKRHAANVTLVMISNRLDQSDYTMFESILLVDTASSIDKPSQIIQARGTLDKLMSKQVFDIILRQQAHKDNALPIISFLFLWVRSSRNMFGDGMMTMRPIPGLIDVVMMGDKLMQFVVLLLKKKVPTLENQYCGSHVSALIRVFHAVSSKVSRAADSRDQQDLQNVLTAVQRATDEIVRRLLKDASSDDPVYTLILFSLLDTSMENECMSYPEFSLKFQRSHPFSRIAAWCYYMAARSRLFSTEDKLKELFQSVYSSLHCRMDVTDVPMSFPKLRNMDSASAQSKEECEVLCSSASPSALQELIYAMQRGYTIDTEEAITHWSRNRVTDVMLFDRLVSIYPLLLPNLVQRGPFKDDMESMLRSLIQLSPNTSLAEKCVERLDILDNEVNNPQSTFFVALWKVYRFSTVMKTVTMLQHTRPQDQQQLTVTASPIFINMMVWASKYGYNSLEARGHTSQRAHILAIHLVICIHVLSDTLAKYSYQHAVILPEYKQLLDVSTNLFCELLTDPAHEQALLTSTVEMISKISNSHNDVSDAEAQLAQAHPSITRDDPRANTNGLNIRSPVDAGLWLTRQFTNAQGTDQSGRTAVWMLVAKSLFPPKSDWPHRVQLLSRVLAHAASAGEIHELFSSYKVWASLLSDDSVLGRDMRDEFVKRVLLCAEPLYKSTQVTILETRFETNDPDLCTEEVVHKFTEALQSMDSAQIQIKKCSLRQMVDRFKAQLEGHSP